MPNRIELLAHYLACLQSAARHYPAQLPLYAARDRPRAQRQRRKDHLGSCREGERHRREQGGEPAAGHRHLWRGWHRPSSRRSCKPSRLPIVLTRARSGGAGRHLLHLGQHWSGQGRDAQRRLARVGCSQRRGSLRHDRRRHRAARLVLLPYRRLWPLVLGAFRRRKGCGRAEFRSRRARAALTQNAADDDVDAADGFAPPYPRGGNARPRTSARSVSAARAATRSLPNWRRSFHALTGHLVSEGYGLTETGLAARNPPSGLDKLGSIGMVESRV